MNKKLLTVAVAAAMAAPLAAQAEPTVYGVAHAAVESVDFDANATGSGTTNNQAQGDYWRVVSRQSTLGVKGDEDLGNGLKAVYKMEFQVDISDNGGGAAAGDDNITARNQYVGLSGSNWGSILLGRHDTPLKMMTISRDKFNTTLGDWNEVGFTAGRGAIAEDNRQGSSITYISPDFNGFTAAAQVSPGEDGVDDDGISDGRVSLGAKYVNGPLYIGAAWEETEYAMQDSVAPLRDDQETWRVAGSYQIGDFNLGAMYQDIESDGTTDNVDSDVWQVSGSYAFGNNVVKVAYQEGEVDDDRAATPAAQDSPEYDTWSLGLDHNFSKRTRAYAVYTKTDTNSDAVAAGDGDDWDAFGLGLVHKF